MNPGPAHIMPNNFSKFTLSERGAIIELDDGDSVCGQFVETYEDVRVVDLGRIEYVRMVVSGRFVDVLIKKLMSPAISACRHLMRMHPNTAIRLSMKQVRTDVSGRGHKLCIFEWEASVDPDGAVERIVFEPPPPAHAPKEKS